MKKQCNHVWRKEYINGGKVCQVCGKANKKQACGFCVEFKGNKKQIDKKEMTVAQVLKHDFKSKGTLSLYNANGKLIYCEYSKGYCEKYDYDVNGNVIYFENSNKYWWKQEYDANNNRIYFEDSTGYIVDDRRNGSCNGKVVEIEGKKYKLTEI